MYEVGSEATAEWRQSRLGHDGEEQEVNDEVKDDFRGWRSRRESGRDDGEDENDENLNAIWDIELMFLLVVVGGVGQIYCEG